MYLPRNSIPSLNTLFTITRKISMYLCYSIYNSISSFILCLVSYEKSPLNWGIIRTKHTLLKFEVRLVILNSRFITNFEKVWFYIKHTHYEKFFGQIMWKTFIHIMWKTSIISHYKGELLPIYVTFFSYLPLIYVHRLLTISLSLNCIGDKRDAHCSSIFVYDEHIGYV